MKTTLLLLLMLMASSMPTMSTSDGSFLCGNGTFPSDTPLHNITTVSCNSQQVCRMTRTNGQVTFKCDEAADEDPCKLGIASQQPHCYNMNPLSCCCKSEKCFQHQLHKLANFTNCLTSNTNDPASSENCSGLWTTESGAVCALSTRSATNLRQRCNDDTMMSAESEYCPLWTKEYEQSKIWTSGILSCCIGNDCNQDPSKITTTSSAEMPSTSAETTTEMPSTSAETTTVTSSDITTTFSTTLSTTTNMGNSTTMAILDNAKSSTTMTTLVMDNTTMMTTSDMNSSTMTTTAKDKTTNWPLYVWETDETVSPGLIDEDYPPITDVEEPYVDELKGKQGAADVVQQKMVLMAGLCIVIAVFFH